MIFSGFVFLFESMNDTTESIDNQFYWRQYLLHCFPNCFFSPKSSEAVLLFSIGRRACSPSDRRTTKSNPINRFLPRGTVQTFSRSVREKRGRARKFSLKNKEERAGKGQEIKGREVKVSSDEQIILFILFIIIMIFFIN